MTEQKLEQLLAAYRPIGPEAGSAAQTLAALRRCPEHRIRMGTLLLRQIGFIRLRMWIEQLAVCGIALYCAADLCGCANGSQKICAVLSAAAPLVLLANVPELVRVYNGGMLELELASRHGLAGVCAARLTIFGLTDIVLLLVLSAATAAISQTALGVMLLYCLTPFSLMCAGCLAALRRFRADRLIPAAILLTGVLFGLGAVPKFVLFLPRLRWIWLLVLAAGFAATVWQAVDLFRRRPRSAEL